MASEAAPQEVVDVLLKQYERSFKNNSFFMSISVIYGDNGKNAAWDVILEKRGNVRYFLKVMSASTTTEEFVEFFVTDTFVCTLYATVRSFDNLCFRVEEECANGDICRKHFLPYTNFIHEKIKQIMKGKDTVHPKREYVQVDVWSQNNHEIKKHVEDQKEFVTPTVTSTKTENVASVSQSEKDKKAEAIKAELEKMEKGQSLSKRKDSKTVELTTERVDMENLDDAAVDERNRQYQLLKKRVEEEYDLPDLVPSGPGVRGMEEKVELQTGGPVNITRRPDITLVATEEVIVETLRVEPIIQDVEEEVEIPKKESKQRDYGHVGVQPVPFVKSAQVKPGEADIEEFLKDFESKYQITPEKTMYDGSSWIPLISYGEAFIMHSLQIWGQVWFQLTRDADRNWALKLFPTYFWLTVKKDSLPVYKHTLSNVSLELSNKDIYGYARLKDIIRKQKGFLFRVLVKYEEWPNLTFEKEGQYENMGFFVMVLMDHDNTSVILANRMDSIENRAEVRRILVRLNPRLNLEVENYRKLMHDTNELEKETIQVVEKKKKKDKKKDKKDTSSSSSSSSSEASSLEISSSDSEKEEGDEIKEARSRYIDANVNLGGEHFKLAGQAWIEGRQNALKSIAYQAKKKGKKAVRVVKKKVAAFLETLGLPFKMFEKWCSKNPVMGMIVKGGIVLAVTALAGGIAYAIARCYRTYNYRNVGEPEGKVSWLRVLVKIAGITGFVLMLVGLISDGRELISLAKDMNFLGSVVPIRASPSDCETYWKTGKCFKHEKDSCEFDHKFTLHQQEMNRDSEDDMSKIMGFLSENKGKIVAGISIAAGIVFGCALAFYRPFSDDVFDSYLLKDKKESLPEGKESDKEEKEGSEEFDARQAELALQEKRKNEFNEILGVEEPKQNYNKMRGEKLGYNRGVDSGAVRRSDLDQIRQTEDKKKGTKQLRKDYDWADKVEDRKLIPGVANLTILLNPNDQPANQRWQCAVCGKAHVTQTGPKGRFDLTGHILNAHGDLIPYVDFETRLKNDKNDPVGRLGSEILKNGSNNVYHEFIARLANNAPKEVITGGGTYTKAGERFVGAIAVHLKNVFKNLSEDKYPVLYNFKFKSDQEAQKREKEAEKAREEEEKKLSQRDEKEKETSSKMSKKVADLLQRAKDRAAANKGAFEGKWENKLLEAIADVEALIVSGDAVPEGKITELALADKAVKDSRRVKNKKRAARAEQNEKKDSKDESRKEGAQLLQPIETPGVSTFCVPIFRRGTEYHEMNRMFNASLVKFGKGEKSVMVLVTPAYDVKEHGDGIVFDVQNPVKPVRTVDLKGKWHFEGEFAYLYWQEVQLFGYSPKSAGTVASGAASFSFEAAVLKNEVPWKQLATFTGYVDKGVLEHNVSTTFGHCGSAIIVGSMVCGIHNKGRVAPGKNEALVFTENLFEVILGNA
jgi:hypothetical protein